MTGRAFRALTRHFVLAIVEPPLLSDLGIDALRRTLISVLSFFLCLGVFLPRVFVNKYRGLSRMPTPEPFLRAWPGDTLFTLALPMYIVGLAAVIVSPMLFPDETDYRVLTPLPIRRVELFGAKLAALIVVASTAVVGVNAITSVTFPAVIGGRWSGHHYIVRIAAHWLTACLASAWTVSAVMALQGLCLVVVPLRWRHRITTTLQAGAFLLLLVSVPSFIRLTGRTVDAATVGSAPQMLLPPIWFLGVERCLLDGGATAGYARAAAAAAGAWAATLAVVLTSFIVLFRSAESLAGVADNAVPSRIRRQMGSWLRRHPPLPGPQTAIAGFAVRGLLRSRLHQFVFAVVLGCGLALLTAQIATALEGRSLRAVDPRDALAAALAAPLLACLCTTIGLRAAFLLPLERSASWVFKLLDDPRTRASALNGVASVFAISVLVPAVVVALVLQPRLLGWSTVPAIALTSLAGFCLVELVLVRWRRIPYACGYLPGKRHLTATAAILLMAYGLFVGIGAQLLRWSILHPSHLLFTGGLLLAALASCKRARLRTLGELPLEFEDEDPAAVIVMALGSSGR